MIGRRLIDTLARTPLPYGPGPMPTARCALCKSSAAGTCAGAPRPCVPEQSQPPLRRPCGCVTDVTVFGHTGCPDAPPDPLEAR